MFNIKKSKRGFTLIELLVVISIIGILAAIGLVAFSTATKKARDARRKGDLQAAQKAFEQYYVANSTYAAFATMGASLTGGWANLKDPKNSGTYVYTTSPATPTTDYCICADLEDDTAGNASGVADATCSTIGGGTTHYCLKNIQ